MSVISDAEIVRLLSNDLNDPIVRQALSGFLSGALKTDRSHRVPPKVINRWLDLYIETTPQMIEVSRQMLDRGFRPPDIPEDH